MEDAKAKCPTCGSAFPAGATFCPECGYVVPVTAPAANPPLPMATPPAPQPSVLYVQPPAVVPRESNWGAWIAIAAIVLLAGGGYLLWSGGYLGGGSPSAPSATNVTIDNSPKVSTETPASRPEPAPAVALTPTSLPPAAPPAAIPLSKTPAIDIVSVKGQPLATNPTEWKYGYTVRLRNNTATAVNANLRIQFLDGQGFPVDDALMNSLVLPAKTELSFDGVKMIKTSLAAQISTLRAEMR